MKLNFFMDRNEKSTCNMEMKVCWPKRPQSSEQKNVKQYFSSYSILKLFCHSLCLMPFTLHSQMVILPSLCIAISFATVWTTHMLLLIHPSSTAPHIRVPYQCPHETALPPQSCLMSSLKLSCLKMISTVVFLLKCTCETVHSLKTVLYPFW